MDRDSTVGVCAAAAERPLLVRTRDAALRLLPNGVATLRGGGGAAPGGGRVAVVGGTGGAWMTRTG